MNGPDEIKIATLNLFNYMAPPAAYYDFENIYTHQEWAKKQAWIGHFLLKNQPDIIGFQEVFSGDALKNLLEEQGYPYFSIAGEPEQVKDYIYEAPVVAIASRYPIEDVVMIEPDNVLAQSMGLSDEFSFSRTPLKVSVKLPHLGYCDFYVVHFKSKRPAIEVVKQAYQSLSSVALSAQRQSENAPESATCIGQILAENVLGTWASSVQRGAEAAMLLSDIVKVRQDTQRPLVLMGDFNDDISGDILSHLMMDELRFARLSVGALSDFCLKDAFDLYQGTLDLVFELPRPVTHYYGSRGSVLDYILLSSEFVNGHRHNMAQVTKHQTFDRHLVDPQYEQDSQSSDHAPVMITIKAR
ncbi:endonuclease/exonuclease/phosphatase family protein [Shewanella surugensis]|uniref:Endonuclease/exonuclease/phosphatase family protein n=1 Tax=Shewanella surugensis TaxID=212020 RepID=A0ABT0L6H9_9GAMM|nr:endonuclease/exonuclease/phosphatase family protein [Shewanella surugensis]MCL1123288.1 endonuclease/exonuclease/phosphatase family protein [Shewanella surugensis]